MKEVLSEEQLREGTGRLGGHIRHNDHRRLLKIVGVLIGGTGQ